MKPKRFAHQFRHGWRRHNSRYRRKKFKYPRRDTRRDVHYMRAPMQVQYVCKSTDFFDCAEEEMVSLLQRRPEVSDLEYEIDRLQTRFATSQLAHDGMVALLAQAPRASLAQIQMDKFPHGYRNKQERLYELIDFNDTLMSTILLLDDAKREAFPERAKQAADRICKRVGAPCYTDRQWDSIIRGLTREVAVYRAALNTGFNAWLTEREHDALGIDMQIQDPESGRYINIDVKTPSSFRHRMEQLVKEGRLTERDLLEGDRRSYILETNGKGNQRAKVIVLCILPDLFGDLTYWRFVDEAPMREMLNRLIRDHGLNDGRYGVI